MSDGTDDRPGDLTAALAELSSKLDTVAGATAAVASTQTDLLARMAEAEAHRSEDALDVAQRLDALERQVLALSQPGNGSSGDLSAVTEGLETLTAAATGQRDDVALALDVLARMAEALERSDARTEDRLAAVRDAAAVPVADLQALLTARADHTDEQLAQLAATVEELRTAAPSVDGGPATGGGPGLGAVADEVTARVEELREAVQSLSWQLPEITRELAALRDRVIGEDVADAVGAATDDLGERLKLHTDTALAGMLRLVDERLQALRTSLTQAPGPSEGSAGPMGFEAGAVMGAAQAAWNRLEQRLDNEFDDLGRQLHAMGAVIDQALRTAEAAANRPVVTGDQLRKAASSVKDTVLGASRTRRERRGGPRGLGPGSGG